MLLKMKLKIKSGKELVHSPDKSFEFEVYENKLIVNLHHRWSFRGYKQRKNILYIETLEGIITGVFTGEVPTLSFQYQEKDQLVFYVVFDERL